MFDAVRWRYWRLVDRIGAAALGGIVLAVCGGALLLWSILFRLPALEQTERSAEALELERAARQAQSAPTSGDQSGARLPPQAQALADLLAQAAQAAAVSLDEVGFAAGTAYDTQKGLSAAVRGHGTYSNLKRFLAAALDGQHQLAVARMRLARRNGVPGEVSADIEFVWAPLNPEARN